MTKNRWAGLSIVCFVLWVAVLLVSQISIFGLLLAAGFFGGRAICAAEIAALHRKLWVARHRQDDLTEVLSTVADRMGWMNSEEVPVIDNDDPPVVE